MAPRPQRRAKSVDALKRCNDDPHIIAAVAQLFWHDRKASHWRGLSMVCGRVHAAGHEERGVVAVLMTPLPAVQIEKARSWFQRAVLLDPDHGDAWAQYYAFEQQHGSPELASQVLEKCIAAEPHHGERWQRVSKSLEHTHKSTAQLLPLVVADLENPAP